MENMQIQLFLHICMLPSGPKVYQYKDLYIDIPFFILIYQYKDLSWVWGIDRKISLEDLCLASGGLPCDARL